MDKLSDMLNDEIGLQIIKQVPNPLYYDRGYFIVAENI
jgi:hypothetical protein